MRATRLILVLIALTAGCTHKEYPINSQSTASPQPSSSLFPKPNGFINDYADVFNPTEEQRLNSLVAEFFHNEDVGFAIVTIETTNGIPLFDYSLALAREWKPGGKSGRGLLLVLATKDRQWRLQVSKALESELPDTVCKELGEQSVELYKQGKYAEGVEKYVRAIRERLRKKVI